MEYIQSSLPVIEKEAMNNGHLDYEITLEELKKNLKRVKNGKSTGPDRISNEMIKNDGETLLVAISYTYNIIIKYGEYPAVWKKSIITPIHKSANINDPNNYRELAVADCISKIFCKIINNRIISYLEEKAFRNPTKMVLRRIDEQKTTFLFYIRCSKNMSLQKV